MVLMNDAADESANRREGRSNVLIVAQTVTFLCSSYREGYLDSKIARQLHFFDLFFN